jgi:hypothetical protein
MCFNATATLNAQSAAAHNLALSAASCVNASLAASSWGKYQSGLRAFEDFEAYEHMQASWPLPLATFRRFAVWGLTVRKLQPSTVEAYCSALNFVHHLKGLPPCAWPKDPVFNMILKGGPKTSLAAPPAASLRRVVTLPLLKVIGHRIALANWDPQSKQVIWSACVAAFFSSARLGELLSSSEHRADPTSTLFWSDVQIRDDSILLHIKAPKSGTPGGEFLDLFKFRGHNCCPVAALKSLWSKSGQAASPDRPVFMFTSGRFLTPQSLNKTLAMLLQDICKPGENTISCHSFRAGIPTALSLFPELVSSDEIKGWGRWSSDCYERYTRLKHGQKQKIFDKIAAALTSLHS